MRGVHWTTFVPRCGSGRCCYLVVTVPLSCNSSTILVALDVALVNNLLFHSLIHSMAKAPRRVQPTALDFYWRESLFDLVGIRFNVESTNLIESR